jgi:hypothetical protein
MERCLHSESSAMKATITLTLAAILLSCPMVQAQTSGILSGRKPEAEQGSPVWESTSTVGPSLIHWKVLNQSWEGGQHCVEVVFDAPGVVTAVYHIQRVFSAEVMTSLGPHAHLNVLLPMGWLRDLQSNVADVDTHLGTLGLSNEKLKDCLTPKTRVSPSEVRIVFRGVEMENGRAFGDPAVLNDRRAGQMAFRNILQDLDRICREVASLPGAVGFMKFRQSLIPEGASPDFLVGPPIQQHLKEWTDGILIGHPQLLDTPENFLPRIQAVNRRHLHEFDKQLAQSGPLTQ